MLLAEFYGITYDEFGLFVTVFTKDELHKTHEVSNEQNKTTNEKR